jgi:predicted nuclease with TOPRIM domain
MALEVYLFAAGLIANIATLWVTRGMRHRDTTQKDLEEHGNRITKLEAGNDLTREMLRRSEIQYEKLEVKLDRLLDRPALPGA